MGSQIVGCRPSTKSLDLSEMSSWPDLFEAELLLLEKMGCSAKSHEAIKSIRPDGAASARKSCCVRLIRAISFQICQYFKLKQTLQVLKTVQKKKPTLSHTRVVYNILDKYIFSFRVIQNAWSTKYKTFLSKQIKF